MEVDWGGWEQGVRAKSETDFLKFGIMAEALTTRRRRRPPRQAGDTVPRRSLLSKAGCVGRQLWTDLASTIARRPVGSAIAVGLFLIGGKVSALLQLDQVPNRITNERRAAFTYVCTPLDVADGDSCDVKVSEFN